MPRRGAYRKDFPAPQPRPPEVSRIGIRKVTAARASGEKVTSTLDPQSFVRSTLATELADEWVELASAAGLGITAVNGYRQDHHQLLRARRFDRPAARLASFARAEPDLHFAMAEWLRLLPAQCKTGIEEEANAFTLGVGPYSDFDADQEQQALKLFTPRVEEHRNEQRRRQQQLDQPADQAPPTGQPSTA
ncbi:hypothetical protein ACWGJX_46515 [Streptomyces sp. NPDC054775]